MACMRDLCIRHELIGTLLSESISTLRLYFGSTVALALMKGENFFFNIRALNETFFTLFCYC